MKKFRAQQSCKSLKIGKIMFWNFCLIASVIVGVYSCTEHDEIADVGVIKNEQKITPRSPSTVSDRVYFADYDEFIDYYEDLDLILMTYNGDYFDSIVDLTTSITTLNDVVATTAGYYGPVADPSVRAIVNAYSEFQVDDILVTVISDRQYLLSDVSNGTLKTTIRGLTKGTPLDISSIPAGAQWATPDELEEALLMFWCGCRVRIEVFDCTRIRVYGSCSGFFGSQGGGIVDIEINDDPFRTDQEVANNFEFFIPVTQFNNMSGTISVWAESNCDNATGIEFAYFNFDPAEFVLCDDDERTETVTFTNGTERILTRTYYKKVGLLTKTHNAEMWSETWDGDSWDKSKGNLTVGVDANQKAWDCELLDSKDDDENHPNARHAIVRVNWLASEMYHCTGDLVGHYNKVRNSITINEEVEVEFQCCE